MIAKMKKLDVMLYHREKNDIIASLRDLGLVHIEQAPDLQSESLSTLGAAIKRVDRIIHRLKPLAKNLRGASIVRSSPMKDPLKIMNRFEHFEKESAIVQQSLANIEKQLQQLQPWGDFEPQDIERLQNAQVTIRFFESSVKSFRDLDLDQVLYDIISQTKTKVFFIVIERNSKVDIQAQEISLPHLSISHALAEKEKLQKEQKKILEKQNTLSTTVSILESYKTEHLEQAGFERVDLSLGSELEGKILTLSGWFPEEKTDQITHFLNTYSAYYEIHDPGPDENVPVLLRNGRFGQLFEPITKIFSLPAYSELDPTPFFAPFFALFFGLCLGDLGYGAIIFVLSALLLMKGPRTFQLIFKLGVVLGLLSIVSGFFLNTVFGAAIFDLSESSTMTPSGHGLAFLGAYTLGGNEVYPAMPFAMLLGLCQIFLGLSIQAVNRFRHGGWSQLVFPVGYILIIFSALVYTAHANMLGLGDLVVGPFAVGPWLQLLPQNLGMGVFIGLALTAVFVFKNPKEGLFQNPFIDFVWNIYQFVTGLMSDALSYIRLFALGLAGGLLGFAFNQIAFMFVTQDNGDIHLASYKVVFTILVLIFGHTLNLGLTALGAFVHSLRLTFVEFYHNVQFSGTHNVYSPFRSQTHKS